MMHVLEEFSGYKSAVDGSCVSPQLEAIEPTWMDVCHSISHENILSRNSDDLTIRQCTLVAVHEHVRNNVFTNLRFRAA